MPPARLLATSAFVALALWLAVAPASGAPGDQVEILDVRLPPLVVVDHPFDAYVTLRNKLAEPVTVHLYAALYAPDGGGPCGAQTSPRWRGVVSHAPGVAQVRLGPGEEREWPDPPGELRYPPRWVWLVNASRAREDARYEVCVFAMKEAGSATRDVLEHYDFESRRLQVRMQNTPPTGDFTWTPPVANVTTPYTFTATAEDEDGDAVTYRWDFGRFTTKGRATATGPVAVHRFYPDGEYVVTLEVRDPFSRTTIAKTVQVLPEEVPTPVAEDVPTATPGAGALVAVAALAAAIATRRRRRAPPERPA